MSRYVMCPNCGHRMRRYMEYGTWDGETYVCDYCESDGDDDDIPEGCRACGGPYPDCADSCSIFDDD